VTVPQGRGDGQALILRESEGGDRDLLGRIRHAPTLGRLILLSTASNMSGLSAG